MSPMTTVSAALLSSQPTTLWPSALFFHKIDPVFQVTDADSSFRYFLLAAAVR